MNEIIINFVEEFFRNLGAQTTLEGNYLLIENVPAKFEKFYGKVSPYKFYFIKTDDSETEYLEKGSYTMKTISNYLENTGETTLLKINFEEKSPEDEIRKRLKLGNSRLINLFPKKRFSIFFRFTFHTTFQYMNEKEKIINEIYIHKGKPINGNLKGYPVEEGRKEEINIPNMKEPYFVAKEELKKLLIKKTKKHTNELNSLLEKQIQRIENHFETIKKELKENIKKAEEKLKEYRAEGNSERITKQKKVLENLRKKLNPEEIERDKKRSILIEKSKHSLSINNKLFNTTLIYHPLFSYNAELKNQDVKKIIEVTFNPLTKTLQPIKCSVCGKETTEIYLGTCGHITCKNCSTKCESCNRDFCSACVQTVCEICGSKICKDCKTRCSKCSKVICKSHTITDKLTGKVYCKNCLKKCGRCSQLKIPENFKTSPRTKTKVCEDCYREEMQKTALKGIFD